MKGKALLVGLMIVLGGLRCSAAQIEERAWTDLPIFIVGHEISLALPNGGLVRGKVLAVRADSLEMEVQKTTDSRLQPKGKTVVPRASVSIIEVITKRKGKDSVGAKVVGGAGVLGGLITGGYIGSKTGSDGGTIAGTTIGAVLGGVAGVMLGNNLDSSREITFVRVIPENTFSPAGPQRRP